MNIFIIIFLYFDLYYCGKTREPESQESPISVQSLEKNTISEKVDSEIDSKQIETKKKLNPVGININPSDRRITDSDGYAVPTYTRIEYQMLFRRINENPTTRQIDQKISESNSHVFQSYISKTGTNSQVYIKYFKCIEVIFRNAAYIIHFYIYFYSLNPTQNIDSNTIITLVKKLTDTIPLSSSVTKSKDKRLVHRKLYNNLVRKKIIDSLIYFKENEADLFSRIVKTLDKHTTLHLYLSIEFVRVISPEEAAAMIYNYCMNFLPIEDCITFSTFTQETVQIIRNSDNIKLKILIDEYYMKIDRIVYALSDTFLQTIGTHKTEYQIELNRKALLRHPIIKTLLRSKETELVPKDLMPAYSYESFNTKLNIDELYKFLNPLEKTSSSR